MSLVSHGDPDVLDNQLLPDRTEDVDPCTPHRHGKLKGSKRCFGCGRTRNEIEIEDGA